jgi:hypothetical protein
MPPLLATRIKRSPFTVPVKRYAIWTLIHLIKFPELVIFHCASTVHVKEAESYLVLGVWLDEEVFESTPVLEIDFATIFSVCDLE